MGAQEGLCAQEPQALLGFSPYSSPPGKFTSVMGPEIKTHRGTQREGFRLRFKNLWPDHPQAPGEMQLCAGDPTWPPWKSPDAFLRFRRAPEQGRQRGENFPASSPPAPPHPVPTNEGPAMATPAPQIKALWGGRTAATILLLYLLSSEFPQHYSLVLEEVIHSRP